MTNNPTTKPYDVVIIGAGPGGSSCALSLLQKGLRPLIIEKESFPRYHIGESLTAEMGKRLREFGLTSFMEEVHNFPVKKGVKVWGKDGRNDFYIPVQIANSENKLEDSTTWQVRRDDFDKGLLDYAIEKGASFMQAQAKAPILDGERVVGVQVVTAEGQTQELMTKMVVDASGQSTFMASKSKLTSPVVRGNYDRQVATFAKIENAAREWDETPADDTIIFYREKNHWAWFIPLSETVTSVGIVVPTSYYREKNQTRDEFYREELFNLNSKLTERLENATIVSDVHSASNYSYHVDQFVGPGFLCIGDAHRFVDPIFSFGLHFAFHEGIFAAEAIADYLNGDNCDMVPLLAYQEVANSGQQIIQDFIDCFWSVPLAFLIMAHYQFREQFIDLFSGRVYGDANEMESVKELRRMLAE